MDGMYILLPVLAASSQPEEEEKTLEAVPITEEVSTEDPRPLSPASEVEVQEQHQPVAPEAEVQAEEAELRPASPVDSGMTAKKTHFNLTSRRPCLGKNTILLRNFQWRQ